MALIRLGTRPAAARTDLRERLESLADNCLTDLNAGLRGMVEGDLTRSAKPVTTPIDESGLEGEDLATARVFNRMLATAQETLELFESIRSQMRMAMGDQSCLPALCERLTSLDEHCLTGLREGLTSVAHGDLTVAAIAVTEPLEAAPGNELGKLGARSNSMLANAQAALENHETMRANTSALVSDIATVSKHLGESAQTMNRIADETGRAVGEIAVSMEHVASGSAEQAESVAEAGTAVEGAATVVTGLGEKSREIGEIVSTISGIAAQTNLLALNAAIEAARAGEHGRGFAVVAEEVRKLAEDSRTSAGGIATIIGDIQNQTHHAVEAMGTAQQNVTAVVGVSERNAAAAQQVSAATEETSASSQEVASAAEQVSDAARRLGEAVSTFRLA